MSSCVAGLKIRLFLPFDKSRLLQPVVASHNPPFHTPQLTSHTAAQLHESTRCTARASVCTRPQARAYSMQERLTQRETPLLIETDNRTTTSHSLSTSLLRSVSASVCLLFPLPSLLRTSSSLSRGLSRVGLNTINNIHSLNVYLIPLLFAPPIFLSFCGEPTCS